mgnify:CR=1 FL=1
MKDCLRLLVCSVAFLLIGGIHAQTGKYDQMSRHAKEIIARMTVSEKISQLMNESPAIEHLGIKPYDWWSEGLHGVGRDGRATVFPQPIALGATFDEALVREIGDAVATEGRAKFNVAQKLKNYSRNAGLTFWSPNVNIFRDPRWGRGMETYGEDPLLSGMLGTAYVRGLQGDDAFYLKTGACAKHYAVHSGRRAPATKLISIPPGATSLRPICHSSRCLCSRAGWRPSCRPTTVSTVSLVAEVNIC